MFHGVIKDNTKKLLYHFIRQNGKTKVAVGCSGAFTIETTLVMNTNVTDILSSDVTQFSSALGFFLMDKDYEVSIINPEYSFLELVIEKGLDYKTAVMLYLQDVSEYYKSDNYYNRMMAKSAREDYEHAIDKKVARLNEVKELYTGIRFHYNPKDVIEFVKEIPTNYLFTAFPPFYFGDYEKQYKFLTNTLAVPELECEYKMFDDNSLTEMVATLLERGIDFIIGTNKPELFRDNPKTYFVGYDYFSKNEIVYLLTNVPAHSKIVEIPTKEMESYQVDFITEEELDALDETAVIEIKEIPLDLFDAIRRTRISEKVKMLSAPMTKFGCFANGKLFGVFGVDVVSIKYQGDWFYLLSDLPVTNHGKISKLIPALATSREIREYLKKVYLVDYDDIRTTCFTNKKASMKYRNFWTIANVKIDKNMGRAINYQAPMGKFSIKEVYEKWLRLKQK
jgi:hypothetical protein